MIAGGTGNVMVEDFTISGSTSCGWHSKLTKAVPSRVKSTAKKHWNVRCTEEEELSFSPPLLSMSYFSFTNGLTLSPIDQEYPVFTSKDILLVRQSSGRNDQSIEVTRWKEQKKHSRKAKQSRGTAPWRSNL